ncbi:putative protein kinase UbiB [Posidoniimonas polymericola]|uniref:Protein kinase domain-containing protein n=1 Tax=Posidoniimonas polymericola TaxID=2528002 RepID=A0A5C5YMQ3_9BACT|nr:AarF/UbiB family protein [Posidoniimonas polymericola]TWT76058.1 putative protein kinase UbiB [Posidoniimonas polymericola]
MRPALIALQPKKLSRYAAITKLLVKYGRSDLLDDAGLRDQCGDVQDTAASEDERQRAEQLANDLEQMGPAFIKLGQLLSTRADLLPPVYLAALERLQDDVESTPYETIERIVSEELGVRLSRGFSEFSERPLATASIGQVHRAKLRDGRDVIVKVQRPDIRGQIVDDLDAMHEMAELLEARTEFGRQAGLVALIETLRESLLNELDYRQEAANAAALRENLADYEQFIIPEVIDDYTSSRVITMQYLSGAKITDVSPAVLLEVDRRGLAEALVAVYLHQLLVDGVFHSDPHPGNLVLTRDHRIGLLDFGMVTHVPKDQRRSLLQLLLALADGEGDEAARAALDMGAAGRSFDEGAFHKQISQLVAENESKRVDQLSVGPGIMEIQRIASSCGLRLPHALHMLGKTLLNLDRVVETLDPTLDPTEIIRAQSTEIMRLHSRQRLSLQQAYNAMLEGADLLQHLPQRANRITELIASNGLKVEVDAIDEHKLIAGLEKVANRVTTGLVLAALIVGASLMMHLETSLTLLGYPAIALVFFISAATFGLVLVYRSMTTDQADPTGQGK